MRMRKNPKFPMLTSLRRKTWAPVLFRGCPKWQYKVGRVAILGDLSLRTFAELDYLFAIFASNGPTVFNVPATGTKLDRWMASVERRSEGAAERYEQEMRAHFQKYKMKFRAGYTLPEPPTPQLRVIYDSARKSEGGAKDCGFSGGEFHWRKWPLNNVQIIRPQGKE